MTNTSPENQTPVKSGGKGVTCNVVLLDGETLPVTLDKNDTGRVLFDKVCQHLDLVERDYFGFTYTDDRGPSNLKWWLNLDKKITKQKKPGGAWVFDFALKFYPPDPSALRESLTRWLVVLQTRRDLLNGRLPCTFTTYALLGSYNVQADIGEYDPNDHGNSHDYIRNMTFAPNQTPELLEKISELHKQHKGQTPDEAEKCFLDNAKKLAMYGVDLHKAKDADNNAVMLGICCSGVLIYRDKLRINRFVWPKILKLSYKRNSFYVKIRPGELERGEATIMFKLDTHRLAKRIWKTCVEHHAFFRLRESEKPANNVSFPRFGSKFRYSGRTLYQSRQTAALLDRPPPFFERSQPARNSMGPDAANKSRSMDELGNSQRGSNDYGTYPRNHSTSGHEYDPNRSYDGRDKRDIMGDPKVYDQLNNSKDSRGDDEGSTLQRRPYENDTFDRRDRLHGPDDATLERERHRGADAIDTMGVLAGNIEESGKHETDKERRKREKEEAALRKKEAADKKKQEDEDKKRLEKEKKKKGKDFDTSEDKTDRMGPNDATLNAHGVGPDSVGLLGAGMNGGAYPYGIGLGVGKGDMTGVVGSEQEIENRQYFVPVPKPIKETKDSIKSGHDDLMPFFNPGATSTVGRPKVPPPVAPKSRRSTDDSFDYKTERDGVEETRMVQKVTVSGGDDDDDTDFDAALIDAIRSVTEFNPDMSVERIECVQQIEDVKNGK